jgi:membrane protease YdiL (CAAX protease family)
VYSLVISIWHWDPQESRASSRTRDPSWAGAFIAFLLSVTILAPAVEELTFRGVGISLLRPYGAGVAIVVSGILFGLVHGLLVAFPVLAAFGFVVGWLRLRTDSVYPPMLLHATFNGVALIAAVTVA